VSAEVLFCTVNVLNEFLLNSEYVCLIIPDDLDVIDWEVIRMTMT